jgi:tetratricopeptide (TPR) repeat protein
LGCATKKPQTGQHNSVSEKVTAQTAFQLRQKGMYLAALKQYSELAEKAENRTELHKALCGKAYCLKKLGKMKLALGTLAPLPESPDSIEDCEKLTIAGELLLHLKKYAEAESILEVALSGMSSYQGSPNILWEAPAMANLGAAYLRNRKIKQAEIMYAKAANAFAKNNNPTNQRKCQRILNTLKQLKATASGYGGTLKK